MFLSDEALILRGQRIGWVRERRDSGPSCRDCYPLVRLLAPGPVVDTDVPPRACAARPQRGACSRGVWAASGPRPGASPLLCEALGLSRRPPQKDPAQPAPRGAGGAPQLPCALVSLSALDSPFPPAEGLGYNISEKSPLRFSDPTISLLIRSLCEDWLERKPTVCIQESLSGR